MAKLIKVNSFGDNFDSDNKSLNKIMEAEFSADKNINKEKDLEANKK